MPDPLRILFVHAAHDGLPPEYRVHQALADGVVAGSVDSRFVWQSSSTLPNAADPRISYYDFGRELSLSPKPSRLRRGMMMYSRFPGGLAHLVAAIRRFEPELLYSSQQTHDVDLARAASRITGRPHLIHLHYTVGPWLGRRTLHAIRSSSRLIAVSEFIRQTALLQGARGEFIRTVPNTAPDVAPAPPEREAVRAEFGWDAGTPVVIAAGRLDPGKGHELLLKGFAALLSSVPEAKLLICGRSSTRDDYAVALQARAAELSLERAVRFVGFRADLPRLLRSADLFCLPTEMEPFGLVFLEAMAAGLPCVACFSGAVPEIVLHEQTGLLSYPNDVTGLAANLRRLLGDAELSRRYSERARERARDVFGRESIAALWLEQVRALSARA